MVSLILGIRTTSAICVLFVFYEKYSCFLISYKRIILLGIHVVKDFFNIWFRRFFSEFNRFINLFLHVCFYFLKPFFVCIFLFKDFSFDRNQWVTPLVFLQFFFCTVFRWVRHRVPFIAIGSDL